MATISHLDPNVLELIERHRTLVKEIATTFEQYYEKLKDSPLATVTAGTVNRLNIHIFGSLGRDLEKIISTISVHDENFASALERKYKEINQTSQRLSAFQQKLNAKEQEVAHREAVLVGLANEHSKTRSRLEEATKELSDTNLRYHATVKEFSDRLSIIAATTNQLNRLLEPSMMARLENLPKDHPIATNEELANAVAPMAKELTASALVTKSHFDNVILTKQYFDAEQAMHPLRQLAARSEGTPNILPAPSTTRTVATESSLRSPMSFIALDQPDTEDEARQVRDLQSPLTQLTAQKPRPAPTQPLQGLRTGSKHPASSPASSAQPASKKLHQSYPEDDDDGSDVNTFGRFGLTVERVKEIIEFAQEESRKINSAYMEGIANMNDNIDILERIGDIHGVSQNAEKVKQALESDDLVDELRKWNQYDFSQRFQTTTLGDARAGMRGILTRCTKTLIRAIHEMSRQLRRNDGEDVSDAASSPSPPTSVAVAPAPVLSTLHLPPSTSVSVAAFRPSSGPVVSASSSVAPFRGSGGEVTRQSGATGEHRGGEESEGVPRGLASTSMPPIQTPSGGNNDESQGGPSTMSHPVLSAQDPLSDADRGTSASTVQQSLLQTSSVQSTIPLRLSSTRPSRPI